ncbi:MAG: transglycosylase domain-containing protein, partial [Rhizomicrobium sp.]
MTFDLLLILVRRFVVRWQNWLVGAVLLLAVVVGVRLWPHQSLQGWKPSSVAVYDDNGKLMRLALASDERYRLWVPLADMSPQLVDAVLLQEDNWYWWHPGFNPYGLLRGAWVTYVRHGNRQGGSTITM